jgi:prepilin-type N-terminal cleavage/methylation domain-containing protein
MRLSFMTRPRHKPNRGFSLLEMVMAATIVAGVLVPTMAVMRDAMAKSRELGRRNLMSNYAVSILESQAATTMLNWTTSTSSGDFSDDGHSALRYTASRSDAPTDGGLTGQLMHVQVRVYDDADGNSTFDANELNALYRTKIARLQSYEDEE